MAAKLSQNDRRALAVCAAALLLFGLAQFVVFPLLDSRKRLIRGIASREKAVAEMRTLQAEISQFSRQSSSLSERAARLPAAFSLFSFLEQKGEEAKVKDNILYIKPSDTVSGEGGLEQVAVEMKLQAVPLDRLVALLERIESPEHLVGIERISLLGNKKKDQGGLDAVMRVISLKRTETGGD